MLESEEFEFVVRTQLNTAATRSDVYFAYERITGEFVVIKGPITGQYATNTAVVSSWKEKNGVPFIRHRTRQMVPDRWDEGVPLGCRNEMRGSLQTFLVYDAMVPADKVRRKMHSSKLWSATEVVDWDKVKLHAKPLTFNDTQMKWYTLGLLTRYMFGASDCCDRNFLVVGDTVYSIDEDVLGRPIDFVKELKIRRCERVHEWVSSHYDTLSPIIHSWIPPEGLRDKYDVITTRAGIMGLFDAHLGDAKNART